MSAKIIGKLNDTNFRREDVLFKRAVLSNAMSLGLISFDSERGLFHHKGQILLGMLPDPNGRFTFRQEHG